jgi:hypothetical protein
MSNSINITVGDTGTMRALWSDDLADLPGQKTIRRASHVEPNEDGEWEADMSPVAGPTLGPFRLRQDALDAEVAWLDEYHL